MQKCLMSLWRFHSFFEVEANLGALFVEMLLEYKEKSTHTKMSIRLKIHSYKPWFWILLTINSTFIPTPITHTPNLLTLAAVQSHFSSKKKHSLKIGHKNIVFFDIFMVSSSVFHKNSAIEFLCQEANYLTVFN
jgi:hypothetical protein